MTEEEFIDRWSKLIPADKKFVESYLETLDIYTADVSYNPETQPRQKRIRARERWARTKDLIFYIMKRDGFLTDFYNKWNIKKHMKRLFEEAESEADREFQLKILKEALALSVDDDGAEKKQSKEVVIKFE